MKPFLMFKAIGIACILFFVGGCSFHIYHHYPEGMPGGGSDAGNPAWGGKKGLIMSANLHSYDLKYLDPVDIASRRRFNHYDGTPEGGGMVRQIFEGLSLQDKDYVLTNGSTEFVNKKGFFGDFRREGWANATSRTVQGTSNFKNSFGGNISISAGLDKIGKVTNALSFTKSTSVSTSYSRVYSWAKTTARVYEVTADIPAARLDTSFLRAITQLPNPTIVPDTTTNTKPTPEDEAVYLDFVETWGTHFPTRVEYGGFYVATVEMTEESYAELSSWGVDASQEIEATVKKVTLGTERGGSYEQSDAFSTYSKNSKRFEYYKGGEGTPKNWDINDETVQPYQIDLRRISDLFDPEIMPGEDPLILVDRKKPMVDYAISQYLGVASDQGQSLAMRKYRAGSAYMHVHKAGEGEGSEIYGLIELKLFRESTDKGEPLKMDNITLDVIPGTNLGFGGISAMVPSKDQNREELIKKVEEQLALYERLTGKDYPSIPAMQETWPTFSTEFFQAKSSELEKLLNQLTISKMLESDVLGIKYLGDGLRVDNTGDSPRLVQDDLVKVREDNKEVPKKITIWDTKRSPVPEKGIGWRTFADTLGIEIPATESNRYYFELSADIREEDTGRDAWDPDDRSGDEDPDDQIGKAFARVYLDELTDEPYELKLVFKDGNHGASEEGWHVEVGVMVTKVDGYLKMMTY